MAFYAELVRRKWYCVLGVNHIRRYNRLFYNEWYDSLTEEEKQQLAARKRQRAKQAEYEFNTLMMMMRTVCNAAERCSDYY